MKRVVLLHWKNRAEDPYEIFSNLKILSATYPVFNYNTLSNYLSKNKIAYENNEVRIERKMVRTEPFRPRKVLLIGKRIKVSQHNEEKQNQEYWLSRPVSERLDAVGRLRSQVLIKNARMKKDIGRKRPMR